MGRYDMSFRGTESAMSAFKVKFDRMRANKVTAEGMLDILLEDCDSSVKHKEGIESTTSVKGKGTRLCSGNLKEICIANRLSGISWKHGKGYDSYGREFNAKKIGRFGEINEHGVLSFHTDFHELDN